MIEKKTKILLASVIGGILIITVLLSTIFSSLAEAWINQLKLWTGIGEVSVELYEQNSTFDLLEPAQKRNRYVIVTGLPFNGMENTLIALVNLSDETINLFPYNFQITFNGEKQILGKMTSSDIASYFEENKLFITEQLSLDISILTERIENKQDWKLFRLEQGGKEITLTTELAFKLYFSDKVDNFELIENLYYSLLLDYVIPFDKQFSSLLNSTFKPLYNQKDILSLSEKNVLFYQQQSSDSSLDLPYYLVDVKEQYLTLLRLDKVTPYLKNEYIK